MNWDQVEGNWRHVKEKVKERWVRPTADDLMAAAGRRDRLVGKLLERLGTPKKRPSRSSTNLPGRSRPGRAPSPGPLAHCYSRLQPNRSVLESHRVVTTHSSPVPWRC
jgi:uncharacterized protein YjbJ (UPF0337 family)